MEIVKAGRSFYLRPPLSPGPHLWFVLTDPDESNGEVVVVMLVTKKAHTDETCELEPGDHEFIAHRSAISYSTARRVSAVRIARGLSEGIVELREDMSAQLLERARAGLLASPYTVRAMKDHCRSKFPK